MTLRDLGAIDSQLDALDPNGSLAASGRAASARAPRVAPSDADRALDALAEGVALAPAPSPAPAPTEPKPVFSGLPPDADFTFIPGSMPVPKVAEPEPTLIPGGEPVPRADEVSKVEASTSAWSKKAEPIPQVESPRTPDVGVDENLDFDDLFDDLVAPVAPAPVEVEPAPTLSLDGRVSEVHEEEPLPDPPTTDPGIEILEEDELEIVVDD